MVEDSPGAIADGRGRPGWIQAGAGSAAAGRSDHAGECGIRGVERQSRPRSDRTSRLHKVQPPVTRCSVIDHTFEMWIEISRIRAGSVKSWDCSHPDSHRASLAPSSRPPAAPDCPISCASRKGSTVTVMRCRMPLNMPALRCYLARRFAMQDPLDADPMIFGPLDLDDVQPWFADVKPVDPYSSVEPYTDVFTQGLYDLDMNHWLTDPEITVESLFPSSISPCDLDVHHPSSPHPPRPRLLSANPAPTWATQLWDGVTLPPSPGPPRPSVRHFTDSTLRPARRSSVHVLTSSSAPPFSQNRPPITRSFTRSSHDRDGTVRRKQKSEDPDMRESLYSYRHHHLIIIYSVEARPQTSQTRPFCLAALLYRLDPAPAGFWHQAQCRSGCKGSRSRICFSLSPRQRGHLHSPSLVFFLSFLF